MVELDCSRSINYVFMVHVDVEQASLFERRGVWLWSEKETGS